MAQAKVVKLLADNLSLEAKEEIMTIAEWLKREGFKHGKAEGRAEGEALVLKRLLQLKFGPIPENYQGKIQQADADTLLLWSERVLTAATMQDIFVN